MLYLFNALVCPTVGLAYYTEAVTTKQARRLVREAGGFRSAIGHEATAKVATELLGVPVLMDRTPASMRSGDQALCVRLRGRPPEGRILSRKEMEAIGYDLVLMSAKDW